MKRTGLFQRIFEVLLFIFLYAPIAVLIVFSFNNSKSRTVWAGFTLDWYRRLLGDSAVLQAFTTTILVSAIAALVATVLGTAAAIGIRNFRGKSRTALMTLSNVPVINSEIITGVSLMLLFVSIGSIFRTRLGFWTLLLSHITFNTPYVILSVIPKLRQLDKNMFEAAQDLGATSSQAFFKVILPQISSGVVNGLIIAFTMSIDDFVISYFTSGSSVQTLSMLIYSMTRKRISPEINALSTLLFFSVLTLLIIINIREIRQEKQRLKETAALNPITSVAIADAEE